MGQRDNSGNRNQKSIGRKDRGKSKIRSGQGDKTKGRNSASEDPGVRKGQGEYGGPPHN